MVSPDLIFLKKNTPKTANIKNTSISKANTLNREGKENVIVDIKAYSPSYLPTNLRILVTLSTLKTLANYGPTFKNFKFPPAPAMS